VTPEQSAQIAAGSTVLLMVFFGGASFIFGTIIGSFLNVCIYRLPRGESLFYPPSHCPKCYQPIRWEDNIPVLSWFLLRGRCRFCRQSISPAYPIVEFMTGALFCTYYWRLAGFGAAPTAELLGVYAAHMAFISSLVVATAIDFRFFVIPDEVTIPGMILAPIVSFVLPSMHEDVLVAGHPHVNSLAASLLGAAVGAGFVYGIGAAGKAVLRKEAMGLGDVKLMAMIGGILGWKLTVFTVFISALLGTAYGAVHIAITGSSRIPYGPFLSMAAILALAFKNAINIFIARLILTYSFLLR